VGAIQSWYIEIVVIIFLASLITAAVFAFRYLQPEDKKTEDLIFYSIDTRFDDKDEWEDTGVTYKNWWKAWDKKMWFKSSPMNLEARIVTHYVQED
jgi:hypothetical protein